MRECILSYEQESNTDIYFDLEDFFIDYGFDATKNMKIGAKYTRKLLSLLSDDDQIEVITELKIRSGEDSINIDQYFPVDILVWIHWLPEDVRAIGETYHDKIGEEYNAYTDTYADYFYNLPNAYENTVELVKQIYVYTNKVNMAEHTKRFKKCLYKKLSLLDLFIYRTQPRPYTDDIIKNLV